MLRCVKHRVNTATQNKDSGLLLNIPRLCCYLPKNLAPGTAEWVCTVAPRHLSRVRANVYKPADSVSPEASEMTQKQARPVKNQSGGDLASTCAPL